MATEIVITRVDTSGQERFDATCEVRNGGTATTTMATSGKFLDRNIKITVNTPSGSATAGTGTVNLTAGAGSVATTGNISLTEQSSQPTSGYYVTSTGSGSVTGKGKGTVTVSEGYVDGGDIDSNWSDTSTQSSNTATKYYSVPTLGLTGGKTTVNGTTATRGKYSITTAGYKGTGTLLAGAVFSNAPASGKTAASYVDISSTTDAPELASGGYLYINQGYVDDLKISLAKLIADPEAGAGATSASMLQGFQAYDKDGVLMVGSITTLAPSSTYYQDAASGAVAASALGSGFLDKAYYIKQGSAGNISGGALSGGGLTQGEASGGGLSWNTPSNVTLTDTNNGISVGVGRAAFSQAVNRAKIDRAAASYSVTAGWVSSAGSGLAADSIAAASSTVSLGATSTTKYISAINVPKDKPFTVTMSADTAQDTTSTLAITSAAYRVVTVNGAPGTGGGVQIDGANGKTVKVSKGTTSSAAAKQVTDASGFLTTATPTFSGGTPSVVSTANGITVTGMATSSSATDYYIDAAAHATATRTAVVYKNAVDGWVTVTQGASASAAASSDAVTINAERIYIPASTVGAITEGTLTFAPTGSSENMTITTTKPSGTEGTDFFSVSLSGTQTGSITARASASAGYTTEKEVTGGGSTGIITGSKIYVGKAAGTVTTSGTATVTPVISRIAKPSGDSWTDAASGNAGTIKPTEGVFVAIQSAGSTNQLSAIAKITTAGYTKTDTSFATTKVNVGAGDSAVTYVPIKVCVWGAPGQTNTAGWISNVKTYNGEVA